jgi:TonB family protein
MPAYLNYLIEANLGILLTLVLCRVLFRRETAFGFVRSYLLSGLLVSLVIPLIRISAGPENAIPSFGGVISAYVLPEIVIGEPAAAAAAEVSTAGLSNWQLIGGVYVAGMILFLTLFLYRLFRLLQCIRQSVTYTYKNNYRVVETPEATPAFSFFHYLFIGKSGTLSAADKEQILRHETIHAAKLHSIDILLVELVGIAFWFNPLIRVYKNILQRIHEFQADAAAVEAHDANQYCSLLAKVALQSADYPLANYFNQSLTTKRISMIRTTKRKLQGWKLAFLLPVFAGFFVIVACQDQVLTEVIENNPTISQLSEYPPEIQEVIQFIQAKDPFAEFLYLDRSQIDTNEHFDVMLARYGYSSIFAFHKKDYSGLLLHNVKVDHKEFYEMHRSRGEVLTVVEEPASPVGGMEAFYNYISTNLLYPAEARQKNISGRVFIQFIVNRDGTLSDFEVLQGIGGGCDEEALEVLAAAPVAWHPAKQSGQFVRQRMSVPIMFQL